MVCLMLWHQYLRTIQRLKQQAMDPVMVSKPHAHATQVVQEQC